MSDSFVRVPADDVGKRIETHEVTDGSGNIVQRQVVEVATGPTSQAVTGTVTIQDGGNTITVDGSVSVSNLPASFPVTDNGGSLTIDGAVSVSNFPATQPVSGAVSLDDIAVALYQVLQALQRPISIDYATGRMRVTIDGANSAATVAIGNVATLGGALPRDVISFQLERQSWASNIGSRIA